MIPLMAVLNVILFLLIPYIAYGAWKKLRRPSFAGQTIWITGASSGIGEALALVLSEYGGSLILSGRNTEKLEALKSKIPGSCVIPFDLSDSEEALTKAKEVAKAHRIDILINNAGVSQRASFVKLLEDLSVEKELMEVNFFSQIALTKAVVPQMANRKSGHLVVVSSLAGVIGAPNRCGYSGSKFGITGYYESLRAELPDIDVTVVYPGYILTNISSNALIRGKKSFGKVDPNIASGIDARKCAEIIAGGIFNKETDVYVCSTSMHFVRLFKACIPTLFYRLLERRARKETNDDAYAN